MDEITLFKFYRFSIQFVRFYFYVSNLSKIGLVISFSD